MKMLFQFIQKKSIILLLCCISGDLLAQDWTLLNRIIASDISSTDYYGWSVAIDGNYAVVGGINNNAVDAAGAAYVYYNDAGTWTQVAILKALDAEEFDNFGVSVGISGNYIILGASYEGHGGEDNGYGAAYIFKKTEGVDTWTQIKKITASTRVLEDAFGHSVSISGDYVIVGAPGQDTDAGGGNSSTNAGAAYVFYKDQGTANSWGLVKKISPTSTRQAQAGFGQSVSLNGTYALVGAYNENNISPSVIQAGAAYVFEKDRDAQANSWGQAQRITPVTPVTSSFGFSVSIDGEQAVIGAYGEGGVGAAYVFAKSSGTWTQQKRVVSTSPTATQDSFGYSVSISGNNIIVGSFGDNEDNLESNSLNDAGSAYIFGKDNGGPNIWGLSKKIVASDRGESYYFGWAVAISGNYTVVSADNASVVVDAEVLTIAGAAYIFGDMTALPVTLASFQATKIENQALLRWTTTAETNTNYFEVQRSADGKRWTALGRVVAAKESTTLRPYIYTDKTPNEGQNLYRLKMVDQDGTFTYSRIQNVSFDESVQLAAYPNPVSNKLYFTQGAADQIRSVQITDLTGRVVLTTDKISDQGLSLENLHAGLYIVHIKKKDDIVTSKKVVVRR